MEITEYVINRVNQLFREKFPELTVLHITYEPLYFNVYVKDNCGNIKLYTIAESVINDGLARW